MKLKKCTAILASLIFVSALSLPVFSGCKRGPKISDSLRLDLSNRAKEAQFMPNAQTVMGEEKEIEKTAKFVRETDGEEDGDTAFDVFDMERLLSSLAVIDGKGAGKYLGYEVDEIKTEIYNIVNRAPWTDEWFRVWNKRGETDYYDNWAYLIENDLAYNFLSITRISWRTRASYYDSKTGREVEDYDGGSAIQYNVMRTEYYMEEETEVVEVEMLDVMQAHGKDYLLAYQGLKNAEDKYFIKYNIEAMPRTLLGYAVDTDTPYGANREFFYMQYENSDFELLEAKQKYPNNYRTEAFRQEEAGAEIELKTRKDGFFDEYLLEYDYHPTDGKIFNEEEEGANGKIASETLANLAMNLGLSKKITDGYKDGLENGGRMADESEELLSVLSEKLVNEHGLGKKWSEIFKASERATKVRLGEEIPLPLKVKYHYVDVTERARGDLNEVEERGEELFLFEARGYLTPNPAFRNLTQCDYYLAPALMNEKGEIILLPDSAIGTGNDYNPDFDIMWYGVWLETERHIYARDFSLVKTCGEYAICTVLMEKGKAEPLGNVYLGKAIYKQGFSFVLDGLLYEFYARKEQIRVKISVATSEQTKEFFV